MIGRVTPYEASAEVGSLARCPILEGTRPFRIADGTPRRRIRSVC
jgi:hypothetical protein